MLDEQERDERDVAGQIPSAFGSGRVRGDPRLLRAPNEVAEGITWGQLYFVYGKPPKGLPLPGVQDPPSSGWSSAFKIEEDEFHVTLFHLWTMKSWRVRRDCYELMSFQGSDNVDVARFRDAFPRYYADFRRRGDQEADYATAVRIMNAMGVHVPTEEELGDVPPIERSQVSGGKAAVAPPPKPKGDGSAFKPVKREGRRGEVLAFFLDGSTSASAATSKFGITRSNLLSQLYLLNKEHGIGYTVKGDAVGVQLPEGVEDPFK